MVTVRCLLLLESSVIVHLCLQSFLPATASGSSSSPMHLCKGLASEPFIKLVRGTGDLLSQLIYNLDTFSHFSVVLSVLWA